MAHTYFLHQPPVVTRATSSREQPGCRARVAKTVALLSGSPVLGCRRHAVPMANDIGHGLITMIDGAAEDGLVGNARGMNYRMRRDR
jgi:hypothetical protein